jgi:two-component system, response regulator PdtaR
MGQTKIHFARGKILVVEDELIIAWHIQAIIEALGYSVAGPVSSVDAALGLLRNNTPNAALLDVNLQGTTVLPVAQNANAETFRSS